MVKTKIHIIRTFLLLLMFIGGTMNEAQAATVTYHILTLPINNDIYHMKREVSDKRLEAVKIIVDKQTTVELPAHYKSPLAENFTYYEPKDITGHGGSAVSLYDDVATWKGVLYEVKGDATEVKEGSGITGSTAEYYVVYTYKTSNTIAKLDGTVNYNIGVKGKGFLSLNRGRNNRPAVIPTAKVDAVMLSSEDFSYVANPGNNIGTYWSSGDNKNNRSDVESQFFFGFKFEGNDPYHIIVRTSYNRNYTYIEKNEDGDKAFVYKWYKEAALMAAGAGTNVNAYLSSDDHIRYKTTYKGEGSTNPTDPDSDTKTGYFHGNKNKWSTVALLNNTSNTGYVLMGTRTVDDNGVIPTPSDEKYNYVSFNGYNNINFINITGATATTNHTIDGIYPLKKVTFKVVTPFYKVSPTTDHIVSAPTEWVSQYTVDNEDIDTKYLPTSLLRKYCTYTNKFYSDAACTQEITRFSGANYDPTEGYQVYIGYEVSANIPFKAITPAASYTDDTWKAATWYAMTDRDSSGKKIKWNSTVFQNNGGESENVKESEFAFIGDPYELRVVYRNETSGATVSYVGSDSRTTETGLTKNTSDTGAGYKWEISYDEETKNNAFQLREYKGTAYWYWNTEGGSNIQYSTTNTDRRIRVLPLPEKSCNFYIVDKNGTIAIKATANRTVFSPLLGYASIPEEIRSPFIYGETITFYSNDACTSSITETSNTDNYNIYVKYTLEHLAEKGIQLNSEQRFKVKLNKEYIYYDTTIKSTPEVGAGDEYSWSLEGGDPYAMKIANKSLIGKYVKVDGGTWGNDKALTFVDGIENGSRFIAMSSLYTGIYEVLAATGDANYYHIGRPTESGAETRIYSVNTAGYAHGAETLQFELSGDVPITYHLIDREDNELLTAESYNPRLTLPAEYVSPLVEEYYYYPTSAKATTITEISQDTDEDGNKPGGKGDNHIYVTYVANDIVNFNKGQYMLKFLDPAIPEYHLEDGNDKLTASKIQPIYPYCNGDGNLNIYGDEMQTEQFGGGANTRPRWVWYFESSNSDPYHVRIHSKSTISYNGVSHYTYLTTHAVHFNQDTGENANKKRVVTGGTLPTIASITPTEYMVLGTEGNYRLLTTNAIDDGETNVRRNVTSLEQYWKTYNMVRQDILGDPRVDKDDPERFNDPITMPSERWSELKTKLETKGVDESANRVDGCSWHSYKAYANATRWNGYNDKSNGYEKKVVENIEHWYQTFDMGTGVFDIETADIPPVLVLLDRHGWEVMRRPLPGASTYPAGDELKDLRMYDSPLVDKYYFYSNATKASGCHKYTMRMQNGAERDQVKVNGERYYSTSLGDLPPKTAVVSGGAIQDLYVIYTVKEEYENNYDYDLNENTSPYTESGTSKPYLVLQHGRFYKTENTKATDFRSYFTKPIGEHTNPEGGNVYDLIVNPHNHGGTNDDILIGSNFIGNIFWYVEPNLNIDDEMGIPWVKASGEETETAAKNKFRKDYKDKTGFDPYNIQLRLKNKNNGDTDGRYLTTHMTSTTLNNGIWMGEYNSMTATDVTDVETQAKKLSKTGNYYFKQKDEENYWYVNVKTAYDGTNDATYDTPTSGSYATEWTQQSYKLTLEEACTSPITSEGYDHSEMQITNQTFMAVSDVNGNMQLMPRFDHTKRVHLPGTSPWHTTLSDPEDHALASVDNNASMGPQTTFFVTPQRFHYHIIDNNGREALRYKRGADTYPTITDHFKSPLATNFTYYKGLAEGTIEESNEGEWATATGDFKRTLTDKSIELSDVAKLLPTKGTYYYRLGARGDFSWKKVTVAEGKGLLDKQITGSFAAAKLEGSADDVDYPVYVRYEYDEDADHDGDHILQGRWFTVKLADKDLQADGTVAKTVDETQGTGVSLYKGEDSSRSLTATNSTEYESKRDALTALGDYYFRIGEEAPYTYNKVTVNAVPISSASDYTETQDDDFATLWSNSKPLVIDADAKKWQWKFFVAPTDPSSDYYTEPDPYAVILFNRQANYTTNPSENPSPMGIGIKVPNAIDGANRFALLGHPEGGYALAVAKAYDDDRDYEFVNGESMTLPSTMAATTATEANFTYKTGTITSDARLVLNDDVTHNFTYYVITNDGKLAITATQDNDEADSHGYAPSLPESAQSKLLNLDDYLYYGFAARDTKETEDPSDDTYSVIVYSILTSLSSLYDDVVYVRYPETFDSSKTPYYVPNKKGTADGHVIKHADSNDVPIDINGKLPYNIIWYNDNMMRSTDGSSVSDGGSQSLTGVSSYTWRFEGGDPYALKIKKADNQYIDASEGLSNTPQTFMLLKKDGYDYGVFAKTGDKDYMLSFGTLADPSGAHTLTISKTAPNMFVPFALSTHKLVYHLIINTSNVNTTIPYREGTEDAPSATLGSKDILGTTQRDLTSGSPAGATYQLGHTYMGQTYCVDAGQVSIGDELIVPNEFSRPNCSYYFYIDNIQKAGEGGTYQKSAADVSTMETNAASLPEGGYYYYYVVDGEGYYRAHKESSVAVIVACTKDDYDNCWQDDTGLNSLYKGLEVTKLMSKTDLVGSVVKVNVEYRMATLDTNAGDEFITEMKPAGKHYLWYTFETAESTPQLAHYTNVRGMRAESGQALHYTNDFLWAPLGDPYGFRSFNRYAYKNNGQSEYVLTTASIADNQEVVMGSYESNDKRDIYELLESSTPGNGTFRVHPLLNTDNTIFLRVKESEDLAQDGKLILSDDTPVQEWTYGLSEELLNPYYQGAGNVGGLNDDGKTAYETAKTTYAANPATLIRELQKICYNKNNIVNYEPGYYRLCNQPGASSISPQRYASGYLHLVESTDYDGNPSADADGDENNAIDVLPMHFYSRKGTSTTFEGDGGLTTGFTKSIATQGDIPVPATEYDASTIFQFTGSATAAKMKTQDLYVMGVETDANNGYAKMTDTPTTFHVDDVGGAVVIIYNLDDESRRHYLNYKQGDAAHIYDLHYYENADVDGSKWCMEPASTQNLKVATNNGGDGYYYATFYAPFDVSLPADADGKTYNAYICNEWHTQAVHPVAVPERTVSDVSYEEGKFVPGGTPVIIRVKDESGSVTLTLPTATPNSPVSCIFKGKYLEQLLAVDPSHDVYTMGVPMTSSVSKDADYNTTGEITAPLPEFATSGVGFYINATPNKEADDDQASWQRNNRYVLHNKIYYRAEPEPSPARAATRGVEFVPVIFGDEEEEKLPGIQDENDYRGDGCVYDLMGRKVATRQQVIDGTWRNHLTSGIYIINGKKIIVK